MVSQKKQNIEDTFLADILTYLDKEEKVALGNGEIESHQSLPPLPAPLTTDSLEKYLTANGYRVKNNRNTDGGFWLLHDEEEFRPIAKLLDQKGVLYKYFKDGRKKQPGPHFEIDPNKNLK